MEKLKEFHCLSFEHQMNYDALAFSNVLGPSLVVIQESQIQFDLKLQVSYKLFKGPLAILPNCLFISTL